MGAGHFRMAATNVKLENGKYPIVPLSECLVDTMNGYCIKPVAGPTPHKMLKLNALRPEGLERRLAHLPQRGKFRAYRQVRACEN